MKARICILLATAFCCPAQTTDLFLNRVINFETPWTDFLWKYAGCKDRQAPITTENCSFTRGQMDRAAWKKAREAAKKLFELDDKR